MFSVMLFADGVVCLLEFCPVSILYIFSVKGLTVFFYFSETPGSRPVISPAGFQFLLMDTASQVWYFMLQYLETVEVQYTSMDTINMSSLNPGLEADIKKN